MPSNHVRIYDDLKIGSTNAADRNEAEFSCAIDGEAQGWGVIFEIAAIIRSVRNSTDFVSKIQKIVVICRARAAR